MAEGRLHQPHDKLFKSSFEDTQTAVAFFRQHLPPPLVRLISWPSLQIVPASYIDDRLRSSESDRLYRVTLRSSNPSAPPTEAFVYLLFEHQRREDPWIALRLLTYQLRIWEQFRSAHPLSQSLPPIIPIVLAQNKRAWSLSPRFHALFDLPTDDGDDGGSALAKFVPDFTFRLIQLAQLPFDKISGTVLGVLTLRALKAEQTGDLLSKLVWDERLLLRLSPHHLNQILGYVINVGDIDKTVIEQKLSKLKTAAIQDATMTLAEQYRQEGQERAMAIATKKAMAIATKKAMTLAEQYRQEGRLQGQEKGQLIGKIQLLQDLLGREATPTEALSSRPLQELQALYDSLKAART